MLKPLVFIPGFPASELRNGKGDVIFPPSPGTLLSAARKKAFFKAMLNIPGDLVAGPPIRSVLGIAKQAQSLYDILEKLGYTIAKEGPSADFCPVGWDWRLGVDATPTLDAIEAAINAFEPKKVVVLIHSTGALVFRAFLDKFPDLAIKIEQVLAFGGAWCGTLEALYAVHHGHSESILGFSLLTEDEGADLIGHAQAAYDLFPPDPKKTSMDDVQLVHDQAGAQVGANVNTTWVKPSRPYAVPLAAAADARLGKRSRDFGSLPLTNVVGWGAATWPTAVLEKEGIAFFPPEKEFGDGTVPLVSAEWIEGQNVRTIVIPIGAFVSDPIPDVHAHMWDSLAVTQVFKEVLRDAPRSAFVAAAADADEALDYDSPVTIRLTAQGPAGEALENCVAIAKLNGQKVVVPFKGGTHAVLRVSRDGIHHNAGSDIFHFFIDFRWQGGARQNIAVSFRAP